MAIYIRKKGVNAAKIFSLEQGGPFLEHWGVFLSFCHICFVYFRGFGKLIGHPFCGEID